MTTTKITTSTLIDMVISGAVYYTGGWPAEHTAESKGMRDKILKAILTKGFQEFDPNWADGSEYAYALARLGMFGSCTARVFTAGAYTFSPDALRD